MQISLLEYGEPEEGPTDMLAATAFRFALRQSRRRLNSKNAVGDIPFMPSFGFSPLSPGLRRSLRRLFCTRLALLWREAFSSLSRKFPHVLSAIRK